MALFGTVLLVSTDFDALALECPEPDCATGGGDGDLLSSVGVGKTISLVGEGKTISLC